MYLSVNLMVIFINRNTFLINSSLIWTKHKHVVYQKALLIRVATNVELVMAGIIFDNLLLYLIYFGGGFLMNTGSNSERLYKVVLNYNSIDTPYKNEVFQVEEWNEKVEMFPMGLILLMIR